MVKSGGGEEWEYNDSKKGEESEVMISTRE